jgi:outer membrane protein assembly factor BamE (lipoprotein component of BamABCDE complex)
MKMVIKITLGILLACVVLVGGCTALIAGAADDPEVKKSVAQLEKAGEDLDDMTGENDHNYRAKMRQVELGMSKSDVRGLLGKPRDVQVMRSDYGRSDTWYYGSWQLSFENGVLDGKNRW